MYFFNLNKSNGGNVTGTGEARLCSYYYFFLFKTNEKQ